MKCLREWNAQGATILVEAKVKEIAQASLGKTKMTITNLKVGAETRVGVNFKNNPNPPVSTNSRSPL